MHKISNSLDQSGQPSLQPLQLEWLKIQGGQWPLSVQNTTAASEQKSSVGHVGVTQTNTFPSMKLEGTVKTEYLTQLVIHSHCECRAIYSDYYVFPPPRQIIAVIHQNPTNAEFHRLPSDWERQSHGDGGSVSESCQKRGQQGSERPAEGGENKPKISKRRKQIINSHL